SWPNPLLPNPKAARLLAMLAAVDAAAAERTPQLPRSQKRHPCDSSATLGRKPAPHLVPALRRPSCLARLLLWRRINPIRRPSKVKPSAVSLKQIGIWTGAFERQPASKVQEAGAELEKLGYGAIWFSEGLGREAFTQAALLLAGTSRILVATGIANIYGRDPFTMASGQKTLSEAYPNRYLLGLGVSRVPPVKQLRGHKYAKPIQTRRAYRDAMDAAPYDSVPPATTSRVLAALGPRMLDLAAKRSDGVHSYNVPPEHTAKARELMGADPMLCVEQ